MLHFAVGLHLEALTVDADEFFRLLVFDPADDSRDIDRLAGERTKQRLASEHEVLEGSLGDGQYFVAANDEDPITDVFLHAKRNGTFQSEAWMVAEPGAAADAWLDLKRLSRTAGAHRDYANSSTTRRVRALFFSIFATRIAPISNVF